MRLPYLRPALEAVLFGFERIGMVIRIAWLPILLTLVAVGAIFAAAAGAAGLFETDWSTIDSERDVEVLLEDGEFLAFYIGANLFLPVISLFLLACVHVAAMRAATLAAYEPPSLPFYFALGTRELRYVVTQVLYGLIVIGVMLAAVGLLVGDVALASTLADQIGHGRQQALVIAPAIGLGLAIVLVALWIVLRFLPVLPIAAVENRIAFGDAWAMTKGNFWRLLVSGAFFVSILQGALMVFMMVIVLPAALVLALLGGFFYGLAGPIGFIVMGLGAFVVLALIIATAAFTLAAQSAFPGRVYAYLTGCGEDCKIY